MFNFSHYWFLNKPFISSTPISFMRQQYIDLDGIHNNEQVIIYDQDSHMVVEIQRLSPATGKWVIEFTKRFDKYSDTQILEHYLSAVGKKVVVIANTYGSGSVMFYTVLTRENGKLTVLFEEDNIFQGQIWFEGNDLIVGRGNRYNTFNLINGKLTPVQYKLPIIQGARIIDYSISPSGTINIKRTRFRFNVGDTVQLVRRDSNNVTERILFMDGSQNIDYINHRSAFKIKSGGKININIIPNGYDWDKSKEIKIEAV